MSIELKHAAQQAVDAFDAFCEDDDFASLFALTQKMNALHTAIQQAGAKTDEPVGVPSLIEKAISSGFCGVLPMKATMPMCKAGWVASGGELTFQEIGRIYEEMYKARPLLDDAPPPTHPAPGVPDGYVPVPLQVLRDASEALGNFVSDHGWGDSDMQAMDNLDAYIAQHTAAQAKKEDV